MPLPLFLFPPGPQTQTLRYFKSENKRILLKIDVLIKLIVQNICFELNLTFLLIILKTRLASHEELSRSLEEVVLEGWVAHLTSIMIFKEICHYIDTKICIMTSFMFYL